MRETPRPRIFADGAGSAPPQHRTGRALAHTGASGSGILHRSDGRPPQTPRGARHTGRRGRSGTTPPVPERPPLPFRHLPALAAPRALLPLLLPVLLFAAVTWQVAAGGPLRALDERAGAILARPGGEGPGDTAAEFAADLGHLPVAAAVLALAAVAVVPLGRRRARAERRKRAGTSARACGGADGEAQGEAYAPGARRPWLPPLAAAAALTAVPALVVPLKAWTARPGPDGLPLTAGEGFYPSGHTATAAVAYGAATLLLLPYLRRTAARRALTAGALLLNLAVGAGLVVRGYHWPLDVLGSWLLSVPLLWALAGALTGRPRGPVRRRPRAAPAPAAPGR
ncbi:phosphatase PAP2 family protein [Streptomyces sp. WAC 00631]|nr:phosphatase PAP2 family protein [Streptomyces sp. WAC 00631]